jgi:hypothetical protein
MLTVLVGGVIGFFLLMGLLALAAPERISLIHGVRELTPEGRNEIRAVYGGFGVAIAGLLGWAATLPVYRPGVFLAVAAALAGMAGGRLVAALIERPRRFYPSWFYLALETAMAAVLYAGRQ